MTMESMKSCGIAGRQFRSDNLGMRRSHKSQVTNGIRTAKAGVIVQVKVWLDGVSPMT